MANLKYTVKQAPYDKKKCYETSLLTKNESQLLDSTSMTMLSKIYLTKNYYKF